jgi:hypothetical protein
MFLRKAAPVFHREGTAMIVKAPPNHTAPTGQDDELLNEVVTGLIETFGLDRVKAEVNRRPRPQETGRPALLNRLGSFSFWLIVKTFALRERGKIDTACQRLAKLGLIFQDYYHKPPVSWSTPNKIRKDFYKADSALDKYDTEYSDCIAHVKFGSFKQRLSEGAVTLSQNDSHFANLLLLAGDIVRFELVRDGVGSDHSLYPPPDRPDYSELERAVISLKLWFGENRVKEVLKHLPKRRQGGRPKFWYETRLFALWLMVQNTTHVFQMNIEETCSKIAMIGGVFESCDEELKVRVQVASRSQRIRHLYYKADKLFHDFETKIRRKHVTDDQAPPLKEQLRRLAREMAEANTWMPPVLSLAIPYVLERLKAEGICHCDFEMPERMGKSVNIAQVKFVPDRNGCWIIHPPGVFD